MTHPDEEALAAIALGDLDDLDTAAEAHVGACAACASSVASLKRSAAVIGQAPQEQFDAPLARVWESIVAEVGSLPDGTEPISPPGDVVEISTHKRHTSTSQRRQAPWWVVGAAAAGLVLGSAGTYLVASKPAAGPTTTVLAQAPLDTLDTKQKEGVAELVRVGSAVDLTLSADPAPPQSGYLEVWLINRDLKRMVSVGVLTPGKRGQTFPVSQDLLDRGYVIVDISRESYDDQPQHSGDSLLRGTLSV